MLSFPTSGRTARSRVGATHMRVVRLYDAFIALLTPVTNFAQKTTNWRLLVPHMVPRIARAVLNSIVSTFSQSISYYLTQMKRCNLHALGSTVAGVMALLSALPAQNVGSSRPYFCCLCT